MVNCKFLLHGVEGMKEGLLGTTICDGGLKDGDKNQTKNASSAQIKSMGNRTY